MNLDRGGGQTPLLAALGNVEPSVAVYLINRGADVNLGSGNRTPLGTALDRRQSNTGLIRLLLEEGADPDARHGDVPPIHIAWAHPELAELLLEHGANINARDRERRTILHLALAGRNQHRPRHGARPPGGRSRPQRPGPGRRDSHENWHYTGAGNSTPKSWNCCVEAGGDIGNAGTGWEDRPAHGHSGRLS